MRRGGLGATRGPPRGVRRIAWLRCEVREWMSLRLCYARRDAHFFNILFSSFGVLSARCAGVSPERSSARCSPGRIVRPAMALSPAVSGKGDGHYAVFLARGPDRDFNVLAEGGQEGHQALDGEIAGTVAHEQGYL